MPKVPKRPRIATSTTRYETIIFLCGDDYDEFARALFLGNDNAFSYLIQWDQGETGEIRDTPPWGNEDYLVRYTTTGRVHPSVKYSGYVLSYNPRLSYASLTRLVTTEDTKDLENS